MNKHTDFLYSTVFAFLGQEWSWSGMSYKLHVTSKKPQEVKIKCMGGQTNLTSLYEFIDISNICIKYINIIKYII